MEKKHVVKLTAKERKRLLRVVRQGKNRAAAIQRSHILLKSDEGKSDQTISEMLYISEQTVRRIRIKASELGLGHWQISPIHQGNASWMRHNVHTWLRWRASHHPLDRRNGRTAG